MLLRAVEEKRFLPVGADKEAASDFQLIAGTNRNLQVDVKSGRFREDLVLPLRSKPCGATVCSDWSSSKPSRSQAVNVRGPQNVWQYTRETFARGPTSP